MGDTVRRRFLAYLGPAADVIVHDPQRVREAADRWALRLVSGGMSYATARRYAAEVCRLYGARRPVGRPRGAVDA